MPGRGGLLLGLTLVVAAGLVYALVGWGYLSPRRAMACTLAEESIIPDGPSPFAPVGEDEWAWGPPEAAVTFIAYMDLECPHSAALAMALGRLRDDYPDDLRVVYRHLPLAQLHSKALPAAQALEAAGAQGQFWAMHDLLFEAQKGWVEIPDELFGYWLVDQAWELDLDSERFEADLADERMAADIQGAYEQAIALGLDGTPSLVINGQYYQGPMDAWTLGAYIKLIQLEERQFTACPPQVVRPRKQYLATLHTTRGDIVIELFSQQAPLAVNSFVYLARQGWYDETPFHRVIPGYVTQAGDPSGTGMGGPGYTFADEITPGARFDRAGLVGMANAGRDRNGSQFFITYAAQETLDGQYTLFGRVIEGLDVAESLTMRDPSVGSAWLPPADQILRVTITEE